mgnify:CR=1 FL=1
MIFDFIIDMFLIVLTVGTAVWSWLQVITPMLYRKSGFVI